jgi:hypothetical protein
MHVAVELAEEGIAVFLGPVGQLLDEVLNLFPAGLSKRLCATEVDGIGLYQFWIELVLTDELAETVADLGATAVPVPICVLWRELFARVRTGPDFLDRAETDSVGLAQGAIDGSRFGYAHLCPADERGNIGGIGVTISNETTAGPRLVDCGPEGPTRLVGITKFLCGLS